MRHKIIDDEEVVAEARRFFLEEGAQAPLSALAQRLGISEATIYKRFKTKEALFVRAMGFDDVVERIAAIGSWVQSHPAGPDFLGEVRTLLGMLSALFQVVFPRVMSLLFGAKQFSGKLPFSHVKNPPRKLLAAVVQFVRNAQQGGYIDPALHPVSTAMALIGPVYVRTFFDLHVAVSDGQPLEEYLDHTAAVLCAGLSQREKEACQ